MSVPFSRALAARLPSQKPCAFVVPTGMTSSTVPVAVPLKSPSISRMVRPDRSVSGVPKTSTYSTSIPVVLAENSLSTTAAGGGGVTECAPRPSVASVAKPFHCTAGSNASAPFASPPSMASFRRKVLSAVLVRPVPHSAPGSNPIWPIESITVVPLRRTTASSPLNQPEPFV